MRSGSGVSSAAIVGFGRMGHVHLAVLKDLGIPVLGVADPKAEGIDLGMETRTYARGKQLLEEHQPDLVVIATTTPDRYEHAMLAVASGARFVVLEKPIAASINQANEIAQAASEAGIRLTVNHQSRFCARYRMLKSLVDGGTLGQLLGMTVVGAEFGLAMNGIHYVEIFEWLASDHIDRVSAVLDQQSGSNPRGTEFIDYAGHVTALTAGKGFFQLSCPKEAGQAILVVLTFTHGKVLLDDLRGSVQTWRRPDSNWNDPANRYGSPSEMSNMDCGVETLVDGTSSLYTSLLGETRDFPTAADGQRALAVMAAAVDSASHDGVFIEVADANSSREHAWA